MAGPLLSIGVADFTGGPRFFERSGISKMSDAVYQDEINYLENQLYYREDELAELRKENVSLKQQIEAMKCCGNCKHKGTRTAICIDCSILWPEAKCGETDNWQPKGGDA